MRNLIIGFSILISIFLFSVLSSSSLERKTNILLDHVYAASLLCRSGDTDDAIILLENAVVKWEGLSVYTMKFINQNKLDSVTEAFHNYIDSIDTDKADFYGAREQLIYQLRSVVEQEKLTLNSIM